MGNFHRGECRYALYSTEHQYEFSSCKLIGGVEVLHVHPCWTLISCCHTSCEQKEWASRPDGTMTDQMVNVSVGPHL